MATRTERVVLEYESNLTTGIARDAAAVALLKRELAGLDGSSTKATRSTRELGQETDRLSTRAVKGRAEIDRYSGRLTLLAQVAAGLGPALVPIGAVGVPAAAALANEMAGVGLAAGTAMLAFHGIGTALSALNKAALDPTVTNLNAAQLALDDLPQSARAFARELAAMQPTLMRLREAAAQGLFPGLAAALADLGSRSHDVERILFRVGSVLGDLSRQGAAALAGPEWDDFFTFVSREAPRALVGLGKATGSVVHGLAQLWMAFEPLNSDFTRLIISAADGFDRWASGLAKTQGFTDFIAYLRENGPKVADAVIAISNAVLQIVEAAVPLGGPILQALTGIANAIATIAGSPIGPTILATVTALSLLSRAQASFGKVAESSWVQAIRSADTYKGKVAAARGPAIRGGLAIAGLGLAASGAADKIGLANTATLALTGSLAGPWGAAAGAAAGLLLDINKQNSDYKVNLDGLTQTLEQNTGAITKNTRAYVAQQLQKQGVLDDAQTLGLSLDVVTSSALGNAAAWGRISAEMRGKGQLDDKQAEAAIRLKNAIEVQSGAVSDATSNVGQLNLAVGHTAHNFTSAKTATQLFRDEINRVNAVLTKRSTLRDYQAALDDFTKSVAENGKTLDINTPKGRANQAALDAISSSAFAAAQNLKGVDRAQFLAQARKDFIDAAEKIGLTEKAAKSLADRLGLLGKMAVRPRVYIDGIPKALAAAEAVAEALRRIHDRTVRLTTIRSTGGRTLPGLADGGPVPGLRAPYGDKVLAALAPGEFVVSNRHGQADQHRALLQAINARRYADGGTVADSRSSYRTTYNTYGGGGQEIDYGRLTRALLAARPLYGPVHMQPHNYGDFQRQMAQDHAMASVGGGYEHD